MTGFLQDLRYALRQLRKSPAFAGTAIVILAVGIGGTTAIFSTLNPILFERLPYPNPNQVVTIWSSNDGIREPQTFHTYRELAERNHSFECVAVMKPWHPTLAGTGEPERLEGQQVSAAYFRTLGVAPALGQDFRSSDDVHNGPKLVILSAGLWRRRFGGDKTIIGRPVRLDDTNYTVLGVMAPAFENVLSPTAEVWSLLQYDTTNITSLETREWGHHLRMIGRTLPGTRLDKARADLAWIAKTPVSEFPRARWASLAAGLIIDRLQNDITRGVKPALLAVFSAMILVLLIACVNVSNLILARGAQRHREIAMRAALGAAPPRLIRQLVTESLLLALLGSAFGMLVAQAGIRVLLALSPVGLPRVNAIYLDATAFAFTLAVTVLIGIVVGILPALQASRSDLHMVVQQSSQRRAGSHQRTRSIFVVAEVTLALVLLVSTGLLLHSLRRLFAVPPGFDGSGVLTMQVQTYGQRYRDDSATRRFFAQALDATGRVPGVTAAALTSQLPLSGDLDAYGARFEGDAPEAAYPVFRYSVTPGYFHVLEIPLLRGRLLEDGDGEDKPPVMLISESLAKHRFADQDPIGKHVRVGGPSTSAMFTVVGVVGDVKQLSLSLNDTDAVYTTTTQWHWADSTLSLVVRSRGNPAFYISAIKNAIWSIDKDQPIVRFAQMDDLLAASAAERRFVVILFEAFALLALLLAATGLYGVLSGSVGERTREIGVRSALGASRRSIVALVLRQGMILTGLGILLGLVGAMASTRALASMLFGISMIDPITYIAVILLLVAVSTVACGVPAWRAARIDPIIALRYE